MPPLSFALLHLLLSSSVVWSHDVPRGSSVQREEEALRAFERDAVLMQLEHRGSSKMLKDDFCQGKMGLFAAPSGAAGNDDCRGFYNCFHGAEAMQLCGAGMRFSPTAKYCDWSANVECSAVASPSSPPTSAPTALPTALSTLAPTAKPTTEATQCRATAAGAERGATDAKCVQTCALLPAGIWPCKASALCDCGAMDPTPSPTLSPILAPTSGNGSPSPTSPSPVPTDGATPTAAPSSTSSAGKVFVAYFSNWFQWWADPYKFLPSNIQADKITHLNYAFALIHSQTFEIRHFEDNDVSNWGQGVWDSPCSAQNTPGCSKGLYEQVNELKQVHTHLRTLISLGGWSFSTKPTDDTENAGRMRRKDPDWNEFIFSDMVTVESNRAKFIQSALKFCRTWGFDGLDLDWEYPGYEGRGGRATDKANFVLLLQELRAAFDAEVVPVGKEKLLLTAAVGIGRQTATNAYDVRALDANLDMINLMTYDMYGCWDTSATGIHSQLYAGPGDTFGPDADPLSGEWAVDWWISQGARPEKLLLGIASYSRSYTLASPEAGQGPGAAAVACGEAQPYMKTPGTAAYYEMRKLIKEGAEHTFDEARCGAYLQKGTLWMGYDDENTMRCKAAYIKEKGLLGGLLWDLPEDDFLEGSPLVSAFGDALGVPNVA